MTISFFPFWLLAAALLCLYKAVRLARPGRARTALAWATVYWLVLLGLAAVLMGIQGGR